MKKWLDQYKNGGNINSLNRKVTCSNCGWSWKLSDGGLDPMTCHKCGGDIKMQNGGQLDKYQNKGEVLTPAQQVALANSISKNPLRVKIPAPTVPVIKQGYAPTPYTEYVREERNKEYARNKAMQNSDLAKTFSSFTPGGNNIEAGVIGAETFANLNPVMSGPILSVSRLAPAIMHPTNNAYWGSDRSIGQNALGVLGAAGDVAMISPYFKGAGEYLGYKEVPKPTSISSSVESVTPPQTSIRDWLDDNATFINLERASPKPKSKMYKASEVVEDPNFNIKKIYRGDKETPKVIRVQGKSGEWTVNKSNDGSYYFNAAMSSPLESGKAMLKINEMLPPKPVILEPNSLSLDSYLNTIKLGKRPHWKMEFENYIPLNHSAKNNQTLSNMFGFKPEGITVPFNSLEDANIALKEVNTMLKKQGIKHEADVFSNGNGWYGIKIPNFKLTRDYKKGGVIKDNRGQWAHPGEITQINSPYITMRGVNYPVLGVDNTGHTKMMQPGMDYTFPGQYVTEYPMMQGGGQMSIQDIKDAYKTAAYNYNNRIFPKETLQKRQAAYNTINPTDYTDLRNYGRWLSDEQRDVYSDPRSEEAWKFYLGLNKPEDLRYLRKSKYRPTINATQKNYYSVDPDLEQDLFNAYKDKVELNKTLQTDESELETPLSGDSGVSMLGRFGVSRGQDENGDYLSYYDKYDLKDFAQKRTKGVPYSIYGRIYYPKKEQGGEMISDYKSGGQHGGLDRWFAEKWVDIKTGRPCGRQEGESRNGYPACRPSKRISSDTPKTSSELSSSERERFKREKTSSERISYNHQRREDGGEILNLELMKSGGNVATNPSLWSRAKSLARQKYDVYPSAYANGWAAKWYKSHGGGWRKAEYGMEVMGDGGVPNNPGFNSLPEYVQQNIINNMATGGQKMPPQLAYARFAAAGNLNQLQDYGYEQGGVVLNAGGEKHRIYVKSTNRGEGAKGHIMVNHPTMDKGMWDTIDLTEKAGATTIAQGVAATKKWHRENPYKKQDGGEEKYWRTEKSMVNDPSMDAISKVLLQRNLDKNFMQRAAGFGYQGGIPTRYIHGQDPNSNNISSLLMGSGDNQVYPTIIQTAPSQLSYQPYQTQEYLEAPTWDVADYFATKGYKRAANDMYGMEYKNGGYVVRRSHDRKGKTHVVIGPDGTKKYFGDPNMGERGKSKYGKEAFYARHKKNLAHNPYFRAYARATWEEGGETYAIGGQSTLNPIVKKDNRNWLDYLKN